MRLTGHKEKPLTEPFEADGARRARETLLRNQCVGGDPAIASLLLTDGQIISLAGGEKFIEVGDNADEVFFILHGEAVVSIVGRPRRIRKAPTQVGEMAALDRGSPRSANVKAGKSGLVALRIPANRLTEIFELHPEAKERMRAEMADRQRQLIGEGKGSGWALPALWTLLSIAVGLFAAFAVWSAATWTETDALMKLGLTVGAFFVASYIVHERNPAFFWRRMIGIVILAVLGVFSAQRSVSLEAGQQEPTFSIGFSSEGVAMSDGVQIAFIVASALIVALFGYFEHRRMESG